MFGETTDEEYLEGEKRSGRSGNGLQEDGQDQQGGVRTDAPADQVGSAERDPEQGQSEMVKQDAVS